MIDHRIKNRPRKRPGLPWRLALMAAVALAGPASAQLLPRLGGGLPLSAPSLPDLPGQTLDDTKAVGDIERQANERIDRLRALVRANPKTLDVDDAGAAVVRGQVIALSPSPDALAAATRAGFEIARKETLDGLDIDIVVLTAPAGLSTRQAVKRLRAVNPAGRYDFDHLYSGAGAGPPAGETPAPIAQHGAASALVGLVDTGVAVDHPAFAGISIRQEGFAPGGVRPAAHGTAVASLLVGEAGAFQGAAPGARLFAADVYGDGPTGGSADDIVHALAWLGRDHVPVINISLVGPPNLTMEAAVRALVARGVLIVAPTGNDGPAAPPLYPASYPGVIAVTAVDARRRVLPEAGHARHIDFAAPGAGFVAARPGGGYATVRGTSFASPIVAGELARLLPAPDPSRAAQAVKQLTARAEKTSGLGAGLVGEDVASHLRAPGRSN
jgi:subtilisin family serine protease